MGGAALAEAMVVSSASEREGTKTSSPKPTLLIAW
jgi:hypothetical protein